MSYVVRAMIPGVLTFKSMKYLYGKPLKFTPGMDWIEFMDNSGCPEVGGGAGFMSTISGPSLTSF